MDLCPCELRPLWKNASDLGMPFERDVSLDLFVAVVSCSGWWMSEAAGGEVPLSSFSAFGCGRAWKPDACRAEHG